MTASRSELAGAWRWPIAGAAAGLMMIAAMLALRVLAGALSLPELFEDQVIALLPGSLFAFVLDRLQFLPSLVGEGSFCLWLLIRGVNPRLWLGWQAALDGAGNHMPHHAAAASNG